MKHLLPILFMAQILVAQALVTPVEQKVRSFVLSSITETNKHYLGFTAQDNLNHIFLGAPLSIREIDTDSLSTYPHSSFYTNASYVYVPVMIDNSVRCFVVVDSSATPVSLGYEQLAQELTKISQRYQLSLGAIELYRATQINSYLFSVPLKNRESAPNLTILAQGWDKNRSELASEEHTVKVLQSSIK